MVIQVQTTSKHWNYFLCVEDDLLRVSRWIEFAEPNFSCFSLELARLLMVCASEVDVVAKAICRELNRDTNPSNIIQYQHVLTDAFPTLHSTRVDVPRFGLTLTPWTNWSRASTPPLWWTANNRVKHHRSEHFSEANLSNVLNAAAGLFLLLLLNLGLRERSIGPVPQLFEPTDFAYRDGDALCVYHRTRPNLPFSIPKEVS